jgi:hypothetical protein
VEEQDQDIAQAQQEFYKRYDEGKPVTRYDEGSPVNHWGWGASRQRAPRHCVTCGRPNGPTKSVRGECPNCSAYRRRTGKTRPYGQEDGRCWYVQAAALVEAETSAPAGDGTGRAP